MQEQARLEREQYIRSHRQDANPYERVDDPLELLKLAHVRREPAELIRYLPCPKRPEDLYAELDAGRTAPLVSHATKVLECGDVHQAHPLGNVVRAIGLTFRDDWHPTDHQHRLLDEVSKQGRLLASEDHAAA
ncbi:hypothetical protein [Steroidobacter cummioxidans]|uniref:hypothetical protein n=1 Tax=Steroidobacter cummioxidans TaxID=1803913 RepID=UPI0012906536|nr:hypothetical protein [Steroidobacter cummioxidans]